MELRKQQEVAYHDRRERARRDLPTEEFDEIYTNGKWYAIARRAEKSLNRLIESLPKGAVVLDYCCGPGSMSVKLARAGLFVEAIDISPESVQGTQERLKAQGLQERANVQVMDAEKLSFPDKTFDLIICSGVLHHLDVNHAYPQLARVLKPTGKIYCIEALGYNPLIHAYRKLTPKLRTAWEVDHIITHREMKLARTYFNKVDVQYLYLASLLAVPLRDTRAFQPLLAVLERVDDVLLKIPGVQLMAWQTIFVLSDPRSANGG